MRYASLFAGVGGFDLGFDRAGMQCVLQVENDRHSRAILDRWWPDVPKQEDVRNVGAIDADLICGGFPCQDVSIAGKRAGLAGEESGLWFEHLRILQESRPRWAVVENVAGLLSSNGGQDFAVVLRGLVELGYGVCWRVFDSQYFGVAQRRRRVFIVGSLGDGSAAKILFEPEGLRRDSEAGRAEGKEVAKPLGGGSGVRGFRDDLDHGVYVFEPRYARNGRGAPDTIAPPLKAQNGQTGKGDGAPCVAWNWHVDSGTYAFGKPNLTANQPPAVGVRRLTPVECERLQAFPDGQTAGQADRHRYRQMGQAVTVTVAEWIGRRIMEVSA